MAHGINPVDLDNWITGHWGEDQFADEGDAEMFTLTHRPAPDIGDACESCGNAIAPGAELVEVNEHDHDDEGSTVVSSHVYCSVDCAEDDTGFEFN